MSENNDYGNNDEDGGVNHRRRRTILAAIAGSLGIGGYLKRHDLRDYAKKDNYIEGDGATGVETEGLPPVSEEEADASGPHSPWEKDTLTVTAIQGHAEFANDFANDFRLPGIQNAVTFWNDYLSENTDENLTLNFVENASNPDIEITTSLYLRTDDETQYVLPSTNTAGLQPYVRVETLTENPLTSTESNEAGNDIPIRCQITSGADSPAVYEHIAKHVIGRLLGYEIWSEPVDVMTPKHLFGISHDYGQDVHSIFNGIESNLPGTIETLAEEATGYISELSDADPVELPALIEGTKTSVTFRRDGIDQVVDDFYLSVLEQAMENHPEFIDLTNYIEAYEETVASEELAHLDETVSLLEELATEAENVDNSEIRNLENYNTLMERFETMQDWPSNESFSMRIHRHATNAYWSEYNWSENTPTPDQ